MKKMVILILILFYCSLSFASQERLDEIAAIVNDDIVTTSELKHAIHLLKLQMQQGLPAENQLKNQVLTQLINKKLQLQLAKQANIAANNSELDKAIANIAQQNSMTSEELYSRLEQDGMTKSDYRRELKEQLVLHKLQQQEVVRRLNVTPQEIAAYKKNKSWQENTEKEFHVEDILLPISDNPSDKEIAAIKKHAQEAIGLLSDASSSEAIKKFLKKQHIEKQNLGWRKIGELPSIFAEHVSRMSKNSVAGPIQAGNGFHILKLLAVRSIGGRNPTLSDKQIENLLLQKKFEEAVQNWLVKVRAQAFIKVKQGKETA